MSAALARRRRAEIESACRPWVAKAAAAVATQVADARAHAATAISGSLIATPDGRPTAARASRNRSLDAASARLDELAATLAGPSVRSLDGIIRDAWEASYLGSWRYWKAHLGPDVTTASDRPTKAELAAVRGLVLGGYDARTRIANVTVPAFRRLKALVVASASPHRSHRDRTGSLRAWEVATARSVALAASGSITTGAYRCDVLAGRAVIRPELLHDDPSIH